MIGFIFSCLFVIVISAVLGGIPFFIWAILVEMAGLGDYMFSLSYLGVSIVELIIFVSYVLLDAQFDLNVKSIWRKIKNIFKKEKSIKEDKKRKTLKGKIGTKTIELIIIFGCIIFALFVDPHSVALNLIYDNLIVKILYIISVPLFIMNLINGMDDGVYDSFIGGFFIKGCFTLGFLLIGVGISSTALMLADSQEKYKYIGEEIKSWYVYDNDNYDEVRKNDEYKTEYDFLKDNLGKTLNSMKETYDINNQMEYSSIKNNLYRKSDMATYGYEVTDLVTVNDDVEIICIVDKKTKQHKMYKINYRNYSFEHSTDEEFLEIKNSK